MHVPPLSSWNKGDNAYWITVDHAELKLQNYGIGRSRWGASVTYPSGNTSYAYDSATSGPQLTGGSAMDAYTFASSPTPGKARELLVKAWGRALGKTRRNPDSWMVVREKGKVIDAGAYNTTSGPFASKRKAKAVAKATGGHLRGRRADSMSHFHGRGHPDVIAHFKGLPERKRPPSQNVIVDEVDANGQRTGVSRHFRSRDNAERFVDDSYFYDFRAGVNRYRYVLRTKAPLPNPKRKGPSEQSRLYHEAASLHQRALASGDREAIQRANALWAKGHGARRNPKRNPAKHVFEPTFERKLPSYLGGGTVREGQGRYLGEGIHWSEKEGKKDLRKMRADLKEAGYLREHATARLDKRPAREAERLQKVLRAATSGRFALWSSGQGSTQVEGRFTSRKRAEAVGRVLEKTYPGVSVWVEGPGSVVAKLRRMDEEDGLR